MARSARELVLKYVADTKDFVKGTQQAANETKDVDKAADRAEAALLDLAQAYTKVGKAADRAADDIDHVWDGTKANAKEAGREVGSEFASNLGEGLASGDLRSLAQDTAGGLVSAFAALPLGIGAVLAPIAAVATGVFANMQKQAENAATRTAAVFDKLAQDVMDALSETTRGTWVNSMLETLGPDGTVQSGITKIRQLTKDVNISAAEYISVLYEGGPAAEELAEQIRAQGGHWESVLNQSTGVTEKYWVLNSSAKTLLQTLGQIDTETQNAQSNMTVYADAAQRAGLMIDDLNRKLQNTAVQSRIVRAELNAVQGASITSDRPPGRP